MASLISVTHVVLSLDCGGLERIVLDLIRGGRKRGQTVSVICLERLGRLAAQIDESSARIWCLNKQSGMRWDTVSGLTTILRECRPNVVHTHQIGALLYVGPAARKAGVSVIVHTEHNNHIDKAINVYRRLRYRLLCGVAGRHASRFFCVSSDIAREVTRFSVIPARKVEVVFNGIDTLAFSPRTESGSLRANLRIPAHAPVIGTVGRLNEVKRQDLLIHAFRQVLKRFPDCHLVLVGDGPLRGALEALVQSLGLTKAVHFAGYQERPDRFFHLMDVFALSSRAEGMPLVVLEAWAAGIPVIASAVGGLSRIIDSGRTGLLFPSGNVAALTERLVNLLSDPPMRRHLSDEARREVTAHYDTRHMAGVYEQHYHQLLAANAD